MFKKQPQGSFVYFISETHFFSQNYSVLVANLVGTIDKTTIHQFQEFHDEICKSKSKLIILNFRDVSPELDPQLLNHFRDLKTALTQNSVMLNFSGLHPALKDLFLTEKLVTDDIIFNNLADALHATSKVMKKSA